MALLPAVPDALADLPIPVRKVLSVFQRALQPPPPIAFLADKVRGPAGEGVRRAYREGLRDLGRLTYRIAHECLELPTHEAWAAVMRVSDAYPGEVDPAFLLEAREVLQHRASTAGPTPFAGDETYAPYAIGALALVTAALAWFSLSPSAPKE